MNKHIEFLPRLAAYHDGALEAGEHAIVKAHVEQCPQCRAILDDWKAIDHGLKTIEGQPVADLRDEVMSRIAALPSRRRINFVFQKPYWSMAAAAVIVIFSATFWIQYKEKLNTTTPPPPALQAPQREEAVSLPPSTVAPVPSASEESSSSAEALHYQPERATVPAAVSDAQPSPSAAAGGSSDSPPPAAQARRAEAGDREMMALEVKPDVAIPSNLARELEPRESNSALSGTEQTGKTFTSPSAAAVAPLHAEVSGILQQDWPPRLVEELRIYYRIPDLYEPAFVEVNLLPLFDAEFVAVGYADNDLLDDSYDVASARPTRLSPEAAYLVANLRVERAALLARMNNQVRSPEAGQRLADLTWQLANITVDEEDVRHAIAAQDAAMRQNPSRAVQARARIVHLRTLIIR